jgi:hypothetical protein
MSCCNSNCNHDPCGSSFNQALTRAAQYAQYAQTQANAAAQSAEDANNTWLEFNALYLGAFAAAPTVDNEGNPLQEGALYWNSVLNNLWVWDGTMWMPAVEGELYLGGFAVAPTLNNQGLPLVSGNLYWNTASNNLWAHNGTSWLSTNFNETTPFLATGTTTARNLVTRFSDVVNVKDFGAGNGGDDTAAINTAIAAGIAIYFPRGFYKVTSPIVIEKATRLFGDGEQTYISIDHSGNGIVFQPVGAGTSNVFLNNCAMFDLNIFRPSYITTPANNIWLRQCNGFKAVNVTSNDGNTCFRISGGQLNSLTGCRAFVGNTSIVPQFDNGLVIFEESPLSGGGAQPCYTVTINDFIGSSSNKLDYALKIKSMDGLNFSNAYLAFCNISLIGLTRQNVTTGLSAINITNVYCDTTGFFGGPGTPHAIQCTNSLPPGQYGAAGVNISNCILANNADAGTFNALIDFSKKGEFINVTGCYIANSGPPWAVELYDSTVGGPSGKYIFTGNTFTNTSAAAGGGALYAKDVDLLVVDGNIFNDTTTAAYQVLVDGSCGGVSAVGNITDGSATQMVTISTLATFTRNVVLLNAGQTTQNIVRLALPTATTGLPSGAMWNDGGIVKIVP